MQKIRTAKKEKPLIYGGSLHLTRKTDYGIFLLTSLAKNNQKSISIREVAAKNKIPVAFLQKIAMSLQKAGLIASKRGKYGGHTLAKSPQKITIKEIVEALEGPITIAKCLGAKGNNKCDCAKFCSIKNGIGRLNEEIKKTFLSKTLNYFISK